MFIATALQQKIGFPVRQEIGKFCFFCEESSNKRCALTLMYSLFATAKEISYWLAQGEKKHGITFPKSMNAHNQNRKQPNCNVNLSEYSAEQSKFVKIKISDCKCGCTYLTRHLNDRADPSCFTIYL